MATESIQPTPTLDRPVSASSTAVNPNSARASPTSLSFEHHVDMLSNSDVEKHEPQRPQRSSKSYPPDPIEGWPRLAQVMAKAPDLAAFSRFRDLHVKSLLYYQTELTLYRDKIHKLEYDDAATEKPKWSARADKLVQSGSEQFKTIQDMRTVLKEYDEALIRYSRICALPGPEPYNMKTLVKWLRSETGGDFNVRGASQYTWGNTGVDPDNGNGTLTQQLGQVILRFFWSPPPEEDELDLAATAPQRKIDGFTRWVVCDAIRWWKQFRNRKRGNQRQSSDEENTASANRKVKKKSKPEVDDALESWGDRAALRVTSSISTLIACLLPVIAISILSQLQGIKNLLICLAGFAIIFALALIFLTQGTSSRTEIFAATAAFSAVMVVFISIPPAPIIDIFVPPGLPTPSISSSPTLVSVGLQNTP